MIVAGRIAMVGTLAWFVFELVTMRDPPLAGIALAVFLGCLANTRLDDLEKKGRERG